ERHRRDRRNPAELYGDGSNQQREAEQRTAWQQERADSGIGEIQHRASKDWNDEGASEQGGAGDETDGEGEGKVLDSERREPDEAVAAGEGLPGEEGE